MLLKVKDLLKLNDLSNCRIVAGKDGLAKEIRWFWICYTLDGDISKWVKGKEAVFLGSFKRRKAEDIDKLMRSFHENNISALFMVLEESLEEAPEQMIELADKYAIPLFEMPNETPLVEITQSLAKLILQNKTVDEQIGGIIRNCIFGHESDLLRHERDLLNLGYALKKINHIICIKVDGFIRENEYERASEFFQSMFNSYGLFGPFFIHNENAIVLCMGTNRECSNQWLQKQCEELEEAVKDARGKYGIQSIGISESFYDIRRIKKAYRHAKQALNSIAIGENHQSVQQYDRMSSIVKVMLEVGDLYTIEECYTPTIGRLIEYDEKHGTDFLHTMEVFFKERGNVVKSAKTLNIHRNTMIYRVERINSILHCDIEDPDVEFNLMTDFYLYRYKTICTNKN